MMTPFENAAAMTSAAVDTVYGESFQLIAMKSGADVNSARAADSARPSFFVVGAYLAPFKQVLPHARGSIQDDNAHKFAASTPMVSIDNAGLQWPVTTGDLVLRVDTGDLFEVSKPLPDGIRRTVLHLTSKKGGLFAPGGVPSLNFRIAGNSQYLALFGPGKSLAQHGLNFSFSFNSGYLPVFGPGSIPRPQRNLNFSINSNSGYLSLFGPPQHPRLQQGLNFHLPGDSGYLALFGPGGEPIVPNSLDFSTSANSGYLAAIGA